MTAWKVLFLSCVVLLGVSCSITIGTNPNAYPFPPEELIQIPRGVELNVVNGYAAPERVTLRSRVYCDLQHFTETAAAIIRRELGARGVVIVPSAKKTLVLRIVDPLWTTGAWTMKGRVGLTAQMGTESVSVDGEAQTGGNAMRAFNAAILRAVVTLLKNPALEAYLKGP